MTTGFRTVTGTITGQAGSLITFVDTLLDIGGVGAYWVKEFTGTNKAVYRSTVGERYYLRVDDSAAQVAGVRGYASMSDVDTGTGSFPEAAQQTNWNWRKSNTADTTTRTVVGVATDRFFVLLVAGGWSGTGHDIVFFGEPKKLVPGDGGATVLRAVPLAAIAGAGFTSGGITSSLLSLDSYTPPAANSNQMMPFARSADGASSAAAGVYIRANGNTSNPYSGYPVLQCWPVVAGSSISVANGIPRAIIPFLFVTQLASNDAGVNSGDTFSDASGATYVLAAANGTSAPAANHTFAALMTSDHETGLA